MITMLLLWLQTTGELTGTIRTGGPIRQEAIIELVALDASAAPEPVADTVTIDQRDLSFLPRTITATIGTTMLFRNSDPILHNVFSPAGPDGGFDLGTYPRPAARAHRFLESGQWVVLCHVHPEMVAYIAIVESRWHTTADRDGRFTMTGVPPGRYRLRAWFPRATPVVREIEIAAGRTTEAHLELPSDRRRGP
ncbi:MAG: carboxypeptidase regulatory-like domain-containing protein [Gemmatimonadales bacterium]|nr:carboxypeptidase regulatory-like domain-containing protein [Gemmatimonadales bacterium]